MARKATHADRLRKHFFWLADQLGVEVREQDKLAQRSCAYAATIIEAGNPNGGRAIVALPHRIRNSAEYFVALHELGHTEQTRRLRGGGWRIYNRYPTLESEARAWNYALLHACITPSRAVWRRILDSLDGYGMNRRLKQSDTFDALRAYAYARVWSLEKPIGYTSGLV